MDVDAPTQQPGAISAASTVPSEIDPSARHLLERLAVVETRVHAEVERRRQTQSDEAQDRFRGLYVSELRVDELFEQGPLEPITFDAEVAQWLEEIERDAARARQAGERLRLPELTEEFALSPLDVELLLVALAPDVDPRFEPLYGYLNDDVSMRRATVGLALQLCGISLASARGRARLGLNGPLVRDGLVALEDADRPLLTRSVRVHDRVVEHLLGGDVEEDIVRRHLVSIVPVPGETADRVARALALGASSVYVVDHRGSTAASSAAAGIQASGRPVVAVDLRHLDRDTAIDDLVLASGREARLQGATLVIGPLDPVADRGARDIRALTSARGTVVLHGALAWDPSWSADPPVVVAADRLPTETQGELWKEHLDEVLDIDVDPVAVTAHFRLTPEQIQRAARSARSQARLEGRPVGRADLLRGARSQNAAGLQRLARRVEPQAGWDDIILPDEVHAHLRELASRWRLRDLVLDEWGMGNGAARGRGVSALFAGGSGTGKTLASEVIARELGLDLYLVDLSTVVDKYIGETSKNLERIFDEADRINGVLLFDEADALFGKRSAVSDAKDRHANVEVAYLLQRMETFDGVAILTTNLAANLDEAFMRRLDAIVDFPSPDEEQRARLWRAKLGVDLPQSDDIEVELLAERFKLSGSEIRNIVISAAYRAAAGRRAVTMGDLVQATVREHRKIGRHLSSADLTGLEHHLGTER